MGFDCLTVLLVVSDSLGALRRSDVFRLLELAADFGEGELAAMADFVRCGRPDLAAEVDSCMAEV